MNLSWIARGAASAERGRRLMMLRGVTPNGHPLWAPWEVGPLVGQYPDYRSIFPVLSRRTHPAVYNKAGRLGITMRRAPPWSDNEILRLRKVYPKGTKEEALVAFPGRTYAAVAKAANARGIYKQPKPEKPTGNRLLDQVLTRAKELGFTRADLDVLCRSRKYYRTRSWRSRPNEAFHCLAVRALGGVVRARF
jgi:hypothetical protein